jgi:DNA-directed RNA polymerase subunit K/omega
MSPAAVLAQPSPKHAIHEAVPVVHRPSETSAFEFVVVSGLRAAQLMRGCIPRVETGHKVIVIAQLEVAAGLVTSLPRVPVPVAQIA